MLEELIHAGAAAGNRWRPVRAWTGERAASASTHAPPYHDGAVHALEAELQRFRETHPPPTEGVSWQVRELLTRIHDDLFDAELNVKTLKRRCRIRDNNVSCRFKHEMGVPIKRYIESLRLEAASHLLRRSAFSVADVAQGLGYRNLQTFYRAFGRRHCCPPGALRRIDAASRRGRRLTREQRAVLAAAMERILPSADGPGAAEANAIGYADWVTRQGCSASLRRRLIEGLTLIESLATCMWGKAFAVCHPREQDAVLEKIRNIPHPTVRRFFAILIKLTLRGFLCAPTYGGNRNGVGWRYIGFAPHPLTTGARDVIGG